MFENLTDLPEWHDENSDLDDALSPGEQRPEPRPVMVHAKTLYNHWRQVFRALQAALPPADDAKRAAVPEAIADIRDEIRGHIFEDCLEVGAKFQVLWELVDERILLLETAASIRYHAKRLMQRSTRSICLPTRMARPPCRRSM